MTDDARLAATLERWLPPPVRIRARRRSPYASSFPLERLDVDAGDERAPLALMWKDLTPAALLPDGRRARGSLAPGPSREPRAYDMLAGAGLGTARRHGVVHEPERTWLFLEAVDGARLEHVGEEATWHAVARWLADAHVRLARRAGDGAWPPRWQAPALPAPGERGGGARRRLAALAEPLAAARARLRTARQAVIHGELYPANVLIGEAGRVCVVDWETIARGPALLDLAALTAGRWDEQDEPLAETYRTALPDPPPAAELRAELDACRLVVAAGWLAAPSGWTPPREQARDWLADAELVARRMLG